MRTGLVEPLDVISIATVADALRALQKLGWGLGFKVKVRAHVNVSGGFGIRVLCDFQLYQ